MTATAEPDGLAEFAVELKLLAEAVLERVEPVLRRAAADGKPEWDNCSWCPVCAAAALVRGEQHDVLTAIADHGTAIVTVLREALAGVPVDPVIPDGTEPGVRHRHHGARPEDATRHAESASTDAAGPDPQDPQPEPEPGAEFFERTPDPAGGADSARPERGRLRRSRAEGRRRASRTNTPADAVRDDIRSGGTPAGSGAARGAPAAPGTGEVGRPGGSTGRPGAQNPRAGTRSAAPDSGTGTTTGAAQPGARTRSSAESAEGTRTRARYVTIPVTIKP